jgi:hypothetical protein
MATSITTNNPSKLGPDAYGLGYQSGLFSGDPNSPINQQFFDAAFAGRINTNKIYKESYHCNIVQECGISQWLDQYMGYETDCFPAYSIIETYGDYNQIKIATGGTLGAYPATLVLHLDPATSHFGGGAFILPQVGNTIVTSPNGVLAKVTAVSVASASDSTITIQQRDTTGNTGNQVIATGDQLLVLSGSEIADCACPTGQFAVPDMPIITDLQMLHIGDKGSVCGDAVDKCQWLKIPFTDECGKTVEHWYTEALQKMYQRFEKRKRFEILLNPFFGIIPILRARGLKWTPNSASEITTDDVRNWKAELDKAGIGCREFSIFAGRVIFSQFQRMLLTAGVTQLLYSERPLNDCGWINMEYCGLKVEGLTLHIYEECSFSNGKELGGPNMIYPSSAIIVPMCARPACNRSTNRPDGAGGDTGDTKMASIVYFKSNDGLVWDNKTDSNGIFGPRNTFGTGCRQHEWTVECRFLLEIHCANWWGYMGL